MRGRVVNSLASGVRLPKFKYSRVTRKKLLNFSAPQFLLCKNSHSTGMHCMDYCED